MKDTKPTIYQKVLNVMGDVSGVAKNGHNDFQNYDYATEADILEAIRGSLISNQLVILPQVVSSLTTDTGVTTLHMEFDIIDAETGEKVTRSWDGTGHDKLDKGAYKAYTGAMKYFLMKTFLIPTNDDPEKTGDEPQKRPVGRPAKRFVESTVNPDYTAEDFDEEIQRKGMETDDEKDMRESIKADEDETRDCPKHPGKSAWKKQTPWGVWQWSHKQDDEPKGYCNINIA
jgi:hypothetical protein